MTTLDTKVYGLLFRVKDNTPIPPDEFIAFRPQDNAIIQTLLFYKQECVRIGADHSHIVAVDQLITRVREWRGLHPDRCKVPDTLPIERE